jgi:putative Mg2+ transporter-C (MgtC) family protein
MPILAACGITTPVFRSGNVQIAGCTAPNVRNQPQANYETVKAFVGAEWKGRRGGVIKTPMIWSINPDAQWHALKLAASFFFALPAGFIGEKETHSAGLRTFPLVAMASCGYLLLAQPEGHAAPDVQSRIVQGLLAGIGFIGGGAIVKTENQVHGVATAAGIFSTGVVGAAIAEDRWFMAFVLSLITCLGMRYLVPLKARIGREGPPAPPKTGNPID